MSSIGLRYFSVYGPNELHKKHFANNVSVPLGHGHCRLSKLLSADTGSKKWRGCGHVCIEVVSVPSTIISILLST
jgi:hypothetical protein